MLELVKTSDESEVVLNLPQAQKRITADMGADVYGLGRLLHPKQMGSEPDRWNTTQWTPGAAEGYTTWSHRAAQDAGHMTSSRPSWDIDGGLVSNTTDWQKIYTDWVTLFRKKMYGQPITDWVLLELVSEESHFVIDPWESVRRELSQLRSVWEGTESIAPSPQALRDFDLLRTILPESVSIPDVDVDDENGEITLSWRHDEREGFVSLQLNGDGAVYFLSNLERPIARRYSLSGGQERQLARTLIQPAYIQHIIKM